MGSDERDDAATAAVVADAIGRFHANAPADDLFAPGYVRTGVPVPFLADADTAQEQAAAMHAAAEVRWIEPFETRGDRALVMVTWSHRGAGSGSAGLVWAVLRVCDGHITEVHYRQDEREARGLLAEPE